MKTLITPIQVLRLAFTAGEYLTPEAVVQADIAAAEQRHIRPVAGAALHEKLLMGAYPELLDDYLAAPLALFVRAAVQPRLDIRTGRCGTTAPRPEGAQPAADAALRRLQRATRAQARTLLRRASEHLAAHAARYPEYDPQSDVLNRCSIDGNLVQTR